MENKLTDEIKEAIIKNLPGQTSGVLSEILDEYEKLKHANKEMSNMIEEGNKKTAELKKELQILKDLKYSWDDVLKREDDINIREQKLEVELLKKDLECSKTNTNLMRENFNTVFKNRTLRENIMKNITENDCGSYNSQTGSYEGAKNTNINENKNIDKTEE